VTASILSDAWQLRQLGDIRCDPPLVFREQLGCRWLHRSDTNGSYRIHVAELAKKKKKNATV
jgi:hypothetical protein